MKVLFKLIAVPFMLFAVGKVRLAQYGGCPTGYALKTAYHVLPIRNSTARGNSSTTESGAAALLASVPRGRNGIPACVPPRLAKAREK